MISITRFGAVWAIQSPFSEKDAVKGAGARWHGQPCDNARYCQACKAGVGKTWWTSREEVVRTLAAQGAQVDEGTRNDLGLAPPENPQGDLPLPQVASDAVWTGKYPQTSREAAGAALDAALANLDADQAKVAAWRPGDGHTRVVACAGSGKTTTLVALVGGLLRNRLAPSDLVVTTFTRKAGEELRTRLAKVLPAPLFDRLLNEGHVGTFHALAARRVMKLMPGRFGASRNLDVSPRVSGIPSKTTLWNRVLGFGDIEGTSYQGLNVELGPYGSAGDYDLAAGLIRSTGSDFGTTKAVEMASRVALKQFSAAWRLFEACKSQLSAYDFSDMLSAYHQGLVSQSLTDGAKVVLVDESQDNTEIQLNIARRLSRNGELLLVGDSRQCIFTWNGAYPELFSKADEVLGAKTAELPNNYRSGRKIVEIGNNAARGTDWCLGAEAKAIRDLEGEVEVAEGYGSAADEANGVGDEIAHEVEDGRPPSDFAILCRTNAAAGLFESALVQRKIPVVLAGGTPFWALAEVKDHLAYIKLLTGDDWEAVSRIANKPKRYLGKAFLRDLEPAFRASGDLVSAIRKTALNLKRGSMYGAQSLASDLATLRSHGWPKAVESIVKLLAPEPDKDDRKRGSGDEERGSAGPVVLATAENFGSPDELLVFAAKCVDAVGREDANTPVPPGGRVTISTIHRAKGLEWTHVYVPCSAGTFPHRRSQGDPKAMEEERRLFYVATTRARDVLTYTWAARDLYGKPAGKSTFLTRFVDPLLAPPPTPGHRDDGKAPVLALDSREYLENPGLPTTTATAAQVLDDVSCNSSLPVAGGLQSVEAQVLGGVSCNSTLPVAGSWPLVEVPPPAPPAALPAEAEWVEAQELAERLTEAMPEASGSGEGSRYVEVTAEQIDQLLKPIHGVEFKLGPGMQRTWKIPLPGSQEIRIYSGIAAGEEIGREVGEDSIRVSLVYAGEGKPKPLLAKQPYCCRTRGWRVTLLERIRGVVQAYGAVPLCPRCDSPMQPRTSRSTGSHFLGCVKYPACQGTRG